MKKNKLLIVIGILLLSLSTIILSLGYVLNQFWVRPQLWTEFQQVEKYFDGIFKDLEQIKAYPVFKNSAFSKNAHLEIGQHVSWGNSDTISGVVSLFEKNKTLTEWRQSIKSEQKEILLEKIKDPVVSQTDVLWLEKLTEFDHWNYLDQPEILQKIQQTEKQNRLQRLSVMATLPAPNYNELWAMATVYWLQKYQLNQSAQGSLVYRKVAELIQSTGDLTAAMTAIAMLKVENNFLKTLVVQGIDPVNTESLEAFKRINWAWSAILNLGWVQKWDPRFEPFLSAQYGICPAVREQFMGFEAFADFMQPHIPLEISFDKAYQKFRPFLAELRTTCHQQQFNPIYADFKGQSNVEKLEFKLPNSEEPINFKWYQYLPYIRKAVGANYILATQPNSLKSYQEKTEQ